MPSKSRYSRRRHSSQSKKRKSRRGSPGAVAQWRADIPIDNPVASPEVAIPSADTPAPMPEPTGVQYSYTLTELRRIGILAGVMLVILVVLALVLS